MTCPLQAPHFNQELSMEQFQRWCDDVRSSACKNKGCEHFPGEVEKVRVEKVNPVQIKLF